MCQVSSNVMIIMHEWHKVNEIRMMESHTYIKGGIF